MKSSYLIPAAFFAILISGCGQSLPDCASNEARDLLISMIKKNTASEDSPWNIEPKFDIVNTENKSSEKNSCSAKITFKMPSSAESEEAIEENINYAIKKNELEKDSFSIEAIVQFKEISKFNSKANQLIKISEFSKKWIEFEEAAKVTGPENLIEFLNAHSSKSAYIDYAPVESSLLGSGFKNEDSQECNPPSQRGVGGTVTNVCTHIFVKNNLKIILTNRADTSSPWKQYVYSWQGDLIK